jgi:hypothetical protein
MNDLTFAATLLSWFAVLAVAVFVEATAEPARDAAPAMTRTIPSALHLAKASDTDCTTVASASAAAR